MFHDAVIIVAINRCWCLRLTIRIVTRSVSLEVAPLSPKGTTGNSPVRQGGGFGTSLRRQAPQGAKGMDRDRRCRPSGAANACAASPARTDGAIALRRFAATETARLHNFRFAFQWLTADV